MKHVKKIGTCVAGVLLGALASLPATPPSQGDMQLSQDGYELLLDYESCRLEPYQCSAGEWTDGVGNTVDVDPNKKITEIEAAKDLKSNVARFEKAVNKSVKISITQPVFDALVAFSFNVGTNAFKTSTLLKKLNKGDIKGACNELPRWVYSDGKKLKGLVSRRLAERAMCLEGLQ